MCENCESFQNLLYRVERDSKNAEETGESGGVGGSGGPAEVALSKEDVTVALSFLHLWHQKQCMCIFRDVKNLERFSLVVQSITRLALAKFQQLPDHLLQEQQQPAETPRSTDAWSLEDVEKLVSYLSRMFMLQFPLYLAAKQAGSRLEDLSQVEATSLAVFLDVTGDVADIPLVLLRNVARFCRSGGLLAMTNLFHLPPSLLPPAFAHGLVSILCNLKIWLNPRALCQLFSPVRAAALQYLCKLSDQELRQQTTRAMADFLWNSIKDNVDSPPSLDKEGLELAFKYFSSSTLTMRLCGINQVNTHISMFNEMCSTESPMDVEALGRQLADWIITSKLVEHIFGPNLHVEVIKQSHVILNFLGMEGRLTSSHIEAIWQSAQLKHCSKQVHDLLPPLIKNLEAEPVLHLFKLLKSLPIKEHTEHTIYLAQILQKYIWTSGSSGMSHMMMAQQQQQDAGRGMQRRLSQSSLTSGGAGGGAGCTTPPPPTTSHLHHKQKRGCHTSDEDEEEDEEEEESLSDDVDMQELQELDDEQDDLDDLDDEPDDFSEEEEEEAEEEASTSSSSELGKRQSSKKAAAGIRPLCQPLTDESRQLDASLDTAELCANRSPHTPPLPPPAGSAQHTSSPARRKPTAVTSPRRSKDGLPQQQLKRPREILLMPNSSSSSGGLRDAAVDELELSTRQQQQLDSPEAETRHDNKKAKLAVDISNSSGLPTALPKAVTGEAAGQPPLLLLPAPVPCTASSSWRGGSSGWRDDGSQGAVMTELANLVGASEEAGVAANCKVDAGNLSSDLYSGSVAASHHFMRNFHQNAEEKSAGSSRPLSSGGSFFETVSAPTVLAAAPVSDDDDGSGCSTSVMMSTVQERRRRRRVGGKIGGENLLERRRRPPIRHQRRRNTEDAASVSGASSHLSTKSEKNLADFIDEVDEVEEEEEEDDEEEEEEEEEEDEEEEEEEESCEEELARLAQVEQLGSMLQQQQQLAHMAQLYQQSRMMPRHHHHHHKVETMRQLAQYRMDKVTEPGNTLLWDLVQEGNIEQLAEGLHHEVEKALINLLCFNMERFIRIKFIEGCLRNLEQNRSAVVSLKLLPKLLQSFHNFPGAGSDIHEMTMFIERTHNMTQLFFDNLQAYMRESQGKEGGRNSFYSHTTQVQVRLHFLAVIFSNCLSPDSFRLSQSQVSVLWECLATDPTTADDLFQWLLVQTHNSREQHALGLASIRHLYTAKLPQLQPESMSMLGLNLLSQLGTLVRAADQTEGGGSASDMHQVWRIALQAASTDVSLKAIHILNAAYLGRGEEFLTTCMKHLQEAGANLESNSVDSGNNEERLVRIQRALLLLKSHLETFRRKYAYHFRRLAIAGHPIASHAELVDVFRGNGAGGAVLLRVVVQPGSAVAEKVTFDMSSADLLADLRAEIAVWWEEKFMGVSGNNVGADNCSTGGSMLGSLLGGSSSNSMLNSLRSAIGGGGGFGVGGGMCHLRLLSQGQELLPDMDERSLSELGFKDGQLVFANLGSGAGGGGGRSNLGFSGHTADLLKSGTGLGELPPFPGRAKIPMLLLLEDGHFDQLFELMSRLSTLSTTARDGDGGQQPVLDSKAQIMSRRVWEILLLLPTSPKIMEGLRQIDAGSDFVSLLDPESPQRLLYSFYIIDWLGRPQNRQRRHSAAQIFSADEKQQIPVGWVKRFIQAGGLKHLFNIFLSGVLGRGSTVKAALAATVWSEWRQDCLGALLRLLVQFGVVVAESSVADRDTADQQQQQQYYHQQLGEPSSGVDAGSGSKKRIKWMCSRKAATCGSTAAASMTAASSADRLMVPLLSPVIMDLLTNTGQVMAQLGQVLLDVADQSSNSCHQQQQQYRTGLFGRSQVVHFAMSLLVSWVYSGGAEVRDALFSQSSCITGWLRQLLLEDHDPAVRREACTGIYRLCLGTAAGGGGVKRCCIAPALSVLLEFFDVAQLMKPAARREEAAAHLSSAAAAALMEEPGKEPFGPACRDYFWLVCKLVESLPSEEEEEEEHQQQGAAAVNIEHLGHRLIKGIVSRPCYERRLGGNTASPDDALIGMLNLMAAVLKQRPALKRSGLEFVHHLFDFLFALPAPRDKLLPKCKSPASRTACYDLLAEIVRGCRANYRRLHARLVGQHCLAAHKPYPWEYWPLEEGRSEVGYVGLVNLGATCYMATCVQQLFMIPATRLAVLQNDGGYAPAPAMDTDLQHQEKGGVFGKHSATLQELRRMFAYLLESERKAYNPLSFCKTYTMDQQPLNTGEQKDMAEFFIDLLSKMEEMTPELKEVVKSTFCGTLSNNVVSLDCGHVSTTTEEFYTVRCQVAEMRSLYQSLEEVCVKDMLEGDNMYTCSQCGTKVRAEKRACFKSLPQVLAFNTMRYSFNMVTMLKEKVNTHFSFPFHLDMAPYMEHNLIPKTKNNTSGEQKESSPTPSRRRSNEADEDQQHFEYELIGVTVHTGNADGGHYYAFIKDRGNSSNNNNNSSFSIGNKERWYSFNDAEVKSFDPAQIAAECFGGEMSSRTYDQVTDKFLDLSIEKTNSAYMLFYERMPRSAASTPGPSCETTTATTTTTATSGGVGGGSGGASSPVMMTMLKPSTAVVLSPDLEEWIWQDNRNFIQDNAIFDHTYFNFMWQMVGYLPTTLATTEKEEEEEGNEEEEEEDSTMLSAMLATTFFLETFIHAKEKLNIVQWVEILTKQLDSSVAACQWFLSTMASAGNSPTSHSHWPVTIFLRCNIATIRQMFHRLLIHVIQKLRHTHTPLYLLPWVGAGDNDGGEEFPEPAVRTLIGQASPITQFVRTLLRLLEAGTARPHLKHLTELFSFLLDFAKLGDAEAEFLLAIQAISTCVEFYLKTVGGGSEPELEVSDDDDEDDDIIALPLGAGEISAAARTASLDKMVTLIAVLVEKSRGEDNCIHLSQADLNALTSGKTLLFLYNITRDNINIRQTCNLIFSLTRHKPNLAEHVAEMVFLGVKSPDHSLHFFRLLTLLTELSGGPAGLPCYTTLVMYRVWDLAKACPQAALDWLSIQVTRNRYAQTWLLSSLGDWVEQYLIAHCNGKVRNSASFLLVSLVPNTHFRQTYRNPRSTASQLREAVETSSEAIHVVHKLLDFLLSLLPSCKQYIEISAHGTNKLVSYFQVMNHLMMGKPEKVRLEKYFMDLWNLFHPKLSEPGIPVHPNKQALLMFWHTCVVDCPENVTLILESPQVVRNLAFNYILADHEDAEVVAFNRNMLPTYYGLLRICCSQSQSFCRLLAQHQNIQWAFKNIAPYSTQYAAAVDELMKLMQLFVAKSPDASEEELAEIRSFRSQSLQLFLSLLEGRSSWSTLISVLRILIESNEDRLFVVCNNGLSLLYDAFNILHLMHHEATACHVTQELRDLLTIFMELVRAVRSQTKNPELLAVLARWKDMADMTSRLVTLCNSYTPPDLRETCLGCVKEMLLLWPNEMLAILVPIFHRSHITSADSDNSSIGPYFPRRDRRGLSGKSCRPPRPMLQLTVPASQLEASFGQDPEYDRALNRYFWSFHHLVDLMVRVAVNEDAITKTLIELSAVVGLDGVPLHFQLFPKLWLDIYNSKSNNRPTLNASLAFLVESRRLLEYVEAVLLDERSSLNNQYVFQFLSIFFPKVCEQVLSEQMRAHILQLCYNLAEQAESFNLTNHQALKHLNGDIRALLLVINYIPGIDEVRLQGAIQRLKEKAAAQLATTSQEGGEPVLPASEMDSQRGGSESDSSEPTTSSSIMLRHNQPKKDKGGSGGVGGGGGNKLREYTQLLDHNLELILAELDKKQGGASGVTATESCSNADLEAATGDDPPATGD